MKTIKYLILAITALMISSFFYGCEDDETDDNNFKIRGITVENYPKVDCSTSTQLLQTLIACKLLDVSYKWNEDMIFGGFYHLNINYSQKVPEEFFDEFKVSTTHGAFINLIDGEVDIIVTSRSISRDEKAYADQLGISLDETPIALDAFIFIANRNNPVNNLTQKQIQDIYMGNIKNWRDIGGNNQLITPYIREPNSGSQEKWKQL